MVNTLQVDGLTCITGLNGSYSTTHPQALNGVPLDDLFVCLFVGIKPEKSNSASCVGREANSLGVIIHGQRHKPRAYQRRHDISVLDGGRGKPLGQTKSKLKVQNRHIPHTAANLK